MNKQTHLQNQLDTMRKKKSIHNMYYTHRINYLMLVLVVAAFSGLFAEGKRTFYYNSPILMYV